MKVVFETRLEESVKAPKLPKKAVELLPMPASDCDPQPPPVDFFLRTVLFVDCVGNVPLRVYAVPVRENQSMASVKELIRQAAMPGQVRYRQEEALWMPRSRCCFAFPRVLRGKEAPHSVGFGPEGCMHVVPIIA